MTHVSTVIFDARQRNLVVTIQHGQRQRDYHNPTKSTRLRFARLLEKHQPRQQGGRHIYQVRQ